MPDNTKRTQAPKKKVVKKESIWGPTPSEQRDAEKALQEAQQERELNDALAARRDSGEEYDRVRRCTESFPAQYVNERGFFANRLGENQSRKKAIDFMSALVSALIPDNFTTQKLTGLRSANLELKKRTAILKGSWIYVASMIHQSYDTRWANTLHVGWLASIVSTKESSALYREIMKSLDVTDLKDVPEETKDAALRALLEYVNTKEDVAWPDEDFKNQLVESLNAKFALNQIDESSSRLTA